MLVQQQHATSDAVTTALVQGSDAALADKRPEDAELLARRAVGRDAKYVPARLALGRALEALGRHAEAATVYAEASRISPFSSGVRSSIRRVWIAPLAGIGIVATVTGGVFRIVGGQFEERTVVVGLLISVAALLAVTLVVVSMQRQRFASLSPDDRRLIETQAGGSLMSAPWSGRLLFAGFVIILLSAAVIMFAVGTKRSLDMKVGDCFTLEGQTSITQVWAIPCDLPHRTEIYATVVDPAPPGSPYPGVDAVRAAAKPGCEAAYKTFVGAPYSPSSKLFINILSPEEPYWVLDVRTNWCAVEDRHGDQMSGSAKGSEG